MSLASLLKINKLQVHSPSRDAVQRLLEAANRNLADAHITEISAENRFDAAYKCSVQCLLYGSMVIAHPQASLDIIKPLF